MGVIAESIVAYAQLLIDQTDGSIAQVEKALAISQFCWNLAILPEESREESIKEMQSIVKMDDDEFESFRLSIIEPMIRRHQEMFPRMPRLGAMGRSSASVQPAPPKKPPGGDHYAPCSCGSGRKYKFCCGRR